MVQPDPLLALKNVYAAYGEVGVLKDISVELEAGRCLAVLGANGSGKTTLLRAIMGLLVRREGDIIFDGRNIARDPTHALARHGIALVPEGRHLFSPLTVEENLVVGALPLSLSGRTSRIGEARERVFELFPRLQERRSQAAYTLSGGEQQMLAIGRALMSMPRLLMLDEPSVGLAPMVVEEVFSALRELRRTGLTIIVAEQQVPVVLRLADSGIVMNLGRIEAHAPAQSLREADEIKRIYLGA